MHLILTGINFKVAGIEARETLAFSPAEVEDALKKLKGLPGVEEAMLISTCNRTEVLVHYGDIESVSNLETKILDSLHAIKGTAVLDDTLYNSLRDESVIRHLYRLGSGLESMVIGETQIFGQIKNAYLAATRTGSTGAMLNKLMHRCFRVSKQVRTDTAISEGPTSVSHAAALRAIAAAKDLAEPDVLVVGAGEMARTAIEALIKKEDLTITVINRSLDRSQVLAQENELNARPWDELVLAVRNADIIITATSSPDPILTAAELKTVGKKTIIDIGLPRNVDPTASDSEDIVLYCIDDLNETVDKAIKQRHKEVLKAETIIDTEVQAFTDWYRSLAVEPTIRELFDRFETVRQEELARISKNLDGDQQKMVDQMSNRLMKKLLHNPVSHLKGAPKGHVDTSEYWVGIVRELFDLQGSGNDQ